MNRRFTLPLFVPVFLLVLAVAAGSETSKTNRPPKNVAAPPPEALKEDSAPSGRRLSSLVRRAKALLKKTRQG